MLRVVRVLRAAALTRLWGLERAARRCRIPLAGLALAYTILVTIPFLPVAIGSDADGSWMIGLNVAHSQRMIPGTDVLFTYGPAGYLFFPRPGYAEESRVLIMWMALWFLMALAWVRLTRALGFSFRWLCILAAFTISFVLAFSEFVTTDYVEFVMISFGLVLILPRPRLRFMEFCLLGIITGFAGLIKVNLSIEAAAIYYTCLFYSIARNRSALTSERGKVLFLTGLPVAAFFAWYASLTGNFSSVFAYIRSSLELVQAYSGGAAIDGPVWQFGMALATIGGLFIAVPLIADSPRVLFPGLIPAAVCTFGAFKHSMVRQDFHAIWFQPEMALISLFLLVLATSRRDQRLILAFVSVCILSTILEMDALYPRQITNAKARLDLSLPRASVGGFLNWDSTWKWLDQAGRIGIAPSLLPSRYSELVGNGTAEAVSWSIDGIVANGWRWRPRPIMQTYVAATPHLDLLNAAHVNTRGADYCYLTWAAVDGRHLFLEDPASWRATLNWYDFALCESSRSLLKRRKSPRYGELGPLGSLNAGWGQPVGVPAANGIVVAYANVAQSWTGKLRQFAYRGTAVYLRVTYRSGRNQLFRTVIATLNDGFIIDPLPESVAELSDLMRPVADGPDRVASFAFETSRTSDFLADIPIRWAVLPLRNEDAESVRAKDRLQLSSLTPLWNSSQPLPKVQDAVAVVRGGVLRARMLTIDPQLRFPAGNDLGQYKTIVIRARSERVDSIDLFFGREVEGRGIEGKVPSPGKWYDLVFNMDMNPFWESEARGQFRFDPASALGIGSEVEIAGIWGTKVPAPASSLPFEFYPVANESSIRRR